MQENLWPARLFVLVQDQVIVAPMGGIVALNHLAVWEAIDRFGVPESKQVLVFELIVKTFAATVLKKQSERLGESGHGSKQDYSAFGGKVAVGE